MGYFAVNLRRKIRALVLTLSAVLLSLSGYTFYNALHAYSQAQELARFNLIAADMNEAIKCLTIERGLINRAMLSESPLSQADRQTLSDSRLRADAHLQSAITRLTEQYPAIAEDLVQGYRRFNLLREQVDSQSLKQYSERVVAISRTWLIQSTEFNCQIENTLRHLGKDHVSSGRFYLYHLLALDGLRLRILAGHHASYLRALMLQHDAMIVQNHELMLLKSQIDYLWSGMLRQTAYLNDANISRAKDLVEKLYFQECRHEQERLLIAAALESVDLAALRQVEQVNVRAFEAIFLLIDTVTAECERYAANLKLRSNLLFGIAAVQLIFCLTLTLLVSRYMNRRVFQPLQAIIFALAQIRRGIPVDLPPMPGYDDEIVQLSEGVRLLQLSMAEERRLKQENERLAMTDFLTGCLNKRAFYIQAQAELQRAARENTAIAFVFADLDNMKEINDKYGHLVGDEAVKQFVQSVASRCRPYDLIGRFGGDEFVFCFPRTNQEQALAIVERMQAMLEQHVVKTDSGAEFYLCASFGIAVGTAGEDHDLEWYINQADLALYKAKECGKNCVIAANNLP